MAGEIRGWHPGLPIVDVRDYSDSPYFEVAFKVQILEQKTTPFCELVVAYNPMFGNMLFIDGEIQISEVDFTAYHSAMWWSAYPRPYQRALVIGDGDGGFTRMGNEWSIDLVERDLDIINAGTKYFGADWSKVNLHRKSLTEFEPAGQYDIIMLAIDDGFNSDAALEGNLDRIVGWLKPGGTLAAQAGSDLDPKHPMIFDRYRRYADRLLLSWSRTQVYVRCYFCHENFFVMEMP